MYANEVVCLDLVIMPALHHARVNGGDVYLAKALKLFPIGEQHLHKVAALVADAA